MCTLSFVPRKAGYVVAMNRDERLTRDEALPPHAFHLDRTDAVYPHETSGGTWIAVNQHGITLALLNCGDSSGAKLRSRGEIIPALIGRESLAEVGRGLGDLDKQGILPFRLVGISSRERKAVEWRWDGRGLSLQSFPWKPRHWFSSGLSDERARARRQPVCAQAWRQQSAGTLSWLRRLHRSHKPTRGPFSLCVHRPDACTRSYTEIVFGRQGAAMRYLPGPPCQSGTLPAPLHLHPYS